MLEAGEAIGEDIGGDSLLRLEGLSVGVLAMEQVPDDEQGPLVANEIQRARSPACYFLSGMSVTFT